MYHYIVIDDESLIRKGTIKKLEPISDSAVCVGEAANGKDALSLLDQIEADIIITDMNMTVMDGTQLLPLLTERYPDKQIIVISGYKDFEYTKQAITANAIDYLLKPFSREDIQTCVIDAIKRIESKSIIQTKLATSESEKERVRYDYDKQLIKNLILGYEKKDIHFSSVKLNALLKTHNVSLIAISSGSEIPNAVIRDILIEENQAELSLFIPQGQNNMSFIVLFRPLHAVQPLDKSQIAILLNLSTYLNTENILFMAGASDVHPSVYDLNKAYNEAMSAMNHQLLNSKQQFNLHTATTNVATPIQWPAIDELFFRMETGETEKVKELIDDAFKWICSTDAYRLSDLKYFCFKLTERAKDVLNSYFNEMTLGSSSASIQNMLADTFLIEDIKSRVILFFTNISEMLKEKHIYGDEHTIDNIKTYIEKNYVNNLTVELVSSLFYLNRSYLSHMFKQQAGVNFVYYVNQVRIEKSIELMTTTNRKVYQIAKSVGFDNTKYFYRVFKKHMRMTPKEYMEKNTVN